MINSLTALTQLLISLFVTVGILILMAAVVVGLGYVWMVWYRNREREKHSLDSTLLQIALPRDNEIKIDAAEQLFSAFAGIKSKLRYLVLVLLRFGLERYRRNQNRPILLQ